MRLHGTAVAVVEGKGVTVCVQYYSTCSCVAQLERGFCIMRRGVLSVEKQRPLMYQRKLRDGPNAKSSPRPPQLEHAPTHTSGGIPFDSVRPTTRARSLGLVPPLPRPTRFALVYRVPHAAHRPTRALRAPRAPRWLSERILLLPAPVVSAQSLTPTAPRPARSAPTGWPAARGSACPPTRPSAAARQTRRRRR